MNRRRRSDRPHPHYAPGVGWVLLASGLLWLLLAVLIHGWLA